MESELASSLQCNHWQEDVGTHWKKDTPCPRTKEKPKWDCRRGTVLLKSSLIPARLLEAQTKPCAQQDPGKGEVTPTRNWTRPACECLKVSFGGMGQQWPAAGTEALTAAVLGGVVLWRNSSWRRSSLALRYSHRQMIHKLENSYTKEVLTLLVKV